MNKPNIAILTTVANFDLYNITSKLFPENVNKYIIDGRDGMHGIYSINYMFEKLKHEKIDWLIMADEDVIFNNSNAVFSIINKMEEERFTVAGVRDGGVVKHRKFNPFMINTFFSIINFKEVLSIWDKKSMLKNQYLTKDEFSDKDLDLNSEYDIHNLYEPYYCFYLWLKRKNKKFLYLDAKMYHDNITNTVLFNDSVFLYHTWFARSYAVNKKHTKRIDTILSQLDVAVFAEKEDENIVVFKDANFAKRQKVKKLFKKIKNKLIIK